ncbi:MAG: hypothetical protein V1908_01925 [Candidatus Peregrinibacteria bacterium]
MPKPNLTSEEKLDYIYRYAKRAYHWSIFRGIISFLLFMIFVVLPIIGSVYLYKYLKNFDMSAFKNIQSQFQEFKNFDLNQLSKILGGEIPKPITPKR